MWMTDRDTPQEPCSERTTVAAVCEEVEDHQDRTGEPVILVGQSIVLGEVKAEVPLLDDDPMNDQIIWQQYIQQVESLSPEKTD